MGCRTTMAAAGVLALVALASQAWAQGNVYRWTDKEGKVHFSDVPPPDDATGVSQQRIRSAPGPDASGLPYETQVALKRHPVTLYVGDKCAPCDLGRSLLARRGIPYTERNAQGSSTEVAALEKIAGAPQVPLLLVGDKPFKGFNEAAWSGALDDAGYPRTLLPGHLAPEPVRVGGSAAHAEASSPQDRAPTR